MRQSEITKFILFYDICTNFLQFKRKDCYFYILSAILKKKEIVKIIGRLDKYDF